MISQALILVSVAAFAAASVIPEHHAPKPYKFGYDVKDKHGNQYREEQGNGAGGVKGSYGFTDDRGVRRQMDYVADHAGFRAQVKTNEPGTANQNPAAVQMISDAPYAGGVNGRQGYGLGVVGNGYSAVAMNGPVGYGLGNTAYGNGYTNFVGPVYGGFAYGGNLVGAGQPQVLGYAGIGY